MISRILFTLSGIFAALAAIEAANIYMGQPEYIHGKVSMITTVQTPVTTVGMLEVKNHSQAKYLVDITIGAPGNQFVTRCEVKSLDGLRKEGFVNAQVMVGRFYNDNRCFALQEKTENIAANQ